MTAACCLLLTPCHPFFTRIPLVYLGCVAHRVLRGRCFCALVSLRALVSPLRFFLRFCFVSCLRLHLTSQGVMWCCVVLSLVGGIACVQRLLHKPQYDHFIFSHHAQAVAYYTRHTPHRMSIAVGGCTATQTNTCQTLHARCSRGLSTSCESPHQHGHPLPW